MDFILLNTLFFVVYALLFVIFIIISKIIFAVLEMTTGVEIPVMFIGLFAGATSSLIMLFVVKNMPV